MKVWVVLFQDNIGYVKVWGVFSSLKKAEDLRATKPGFFNEPVEMEVDKV